MQKDKIVYVPLIAQNDSKDIPKVYVWVHSSTEDKVIYVGKTKNSVQKRMGEHRQGFKGKTNNGSVSGSKKFCFLKNILSKDESVHIWAREAEIQCIAINNISTTQLSLFSVEEEWFIKKFNPLLNK
jgi:predicted GIY-YIG superfamily endonuclease